MRPDWLQRTVVDWLGQGMSPRRLALTLALGFAVGCIPVVGVPTVLCAALALGLRLNLPAIQAANYAAMPFQLALIMPFVRLGKLLFSIGAHSHPRVETGWLLGSGGGLNHLGGLAAQALLAWLFVAGPAVVLMTLTLTAMLRRIPAPAVERLGLS
jgi:uncharacterized protein (DUF2062 family)